VIARGQSMPTGGRSRDWLSGCWSRIKLLRCRRVGAGTRVWGQPWIHGRGTILVGRGVVLDGRQAPIELHASGMGVIEIGDGAIVRGGCSVEATARVSIGNGCILGPYVKVIDNQFHPLRGDRNVRPAGIEVRIEDNVEIGPHSILLPGSHVEAGARIGAGSVISRRIPAGAFVAGNPPRRVRDAPPCP
jgi:acetyltransferase-like isoleucine patch superfamily enzyme